MKIIVSGNKIVQKHKNMKSWTINVLTAMNYMYKIQLKKHDAYKKHFVLNIKTI